MSLRHDCRGRQIFCRSCLSFLARFCRNKLSTCPQCAQTSGKTVKPLGKQLSFYQAQPRQHALSRSRLSHTSRPLGLPSTLAAKASVFNGNFLDDVASTVADFTEDGFLQRFFPKNFFQNARLLLWRHGGLGGCVRTSPAGGESAKEMSSTRLYRRRRPLHRHQPLLR